MALILDMVDPQELQGFTREIQLEEERNRFVLQNYLPNENIDEITAGKYGPSHWISWSPQERRVALINRNEGAEWLNIIDTATGTATIYPRESENVNWLIDRESFAWTGDDAFSLKVKTCETCAPETRSFTLP